MDVKVNKHEQANNKEHSGSLTKLLPSKQEYLIQSDSKVCLEIKMKTFRLNSGWYFGSYPSKDGLTFHTAKELQL